MLVKNEIIDKDFVLKMARQVCDVTADSRGRESFDFDSYGLKAFAKLVAEKATEEANARANSSWTLMCKKMVEAEREACAKECLSLNLYGSYSSRDIQFATLEDCARAIRARGEPTSRGEAQ